MAQVSLDDLRRDLEAFEGELNEEFFLSYAGLKEDMCASAVYEKYSHLFTSDAIGAIREAYDSGEATDDRRWLRYLLAFSTLGCLDSAVKELTDRSMTFESQSVVTVDGEAIPYRAVPVVLRNEPDHERRRRIFEAKLEQTRTLNDILYERMAESHRQSVALGYKSYGDMCASLKGVDYKGLEEEMEEFLRRTEQLYMRVMDELLLDRTGLHIGDAWSYDIPFAFRGEEFDASFRQDRLVDSFFATLKTLGIDPTAYPNITVDTEDRPKKTPRAFCAPVKVPEDIRLVIRPTGGWRDYDAFFHEGGHAWHFGSVGRDLMPEYRYLGDNSVTESFAFLFNYLPSNPVWLKSVLGMEEAETYARFTLVSKLMFLRRYAAKLVYEMKLHHGSLSRDMSEVYKNALQKALRFKHTEVHYLEDVDDALYCAEYLRAWILEGQLRKVLTDEFGDAWFQEQGAGVRLRELWSYGQKYTADELVKTVGYVDLDPEPVLEEIERGLAQTR